MRIYKLLNAGVVLGSVLGTHYAVASPLLEPAKAAPQVQAASASDIVEFNVRLPLRHQAELDTLLAQLHDQNSPKYQQWLQPAEFLSRFGPSPAELEKVQASLTAHGFTVSAVNAHGMHVMGPASAIARTFGTAVHKRTGQGRTRYFARGALHVPSELSGMNVRIFGLDAIPEHQLHSHTLGPVAEGTVNNRSTPEGFYWFDDLKQAYDYPAYSKRTDGTGVNVAILMEDLLFPEDVATVFTHEKFTAITGKPAPSVTTVLVDGGGIVNGDGSFEASLDVQQVLGGAPGANVTLVSVPSLADDVLMDGYTYIVDSNTYDIVNSSFGGCELLYTAAYNDGEDFTYILQQYHEIFAQGNAQGITFVASSGDQGAPMCPSVDYFSPPSNPTFQAGVSTPAADPAVTAVGGGNLITAHTMGSLDSTYVRESAFADPDVPYDIYGVGENVTGGVWAAGGGVSSVFAKPLYQYLAATGSRSMRTVPDVGMEVGGCPNGLAASCGADDSAVVISYGANEGGGFFGVIGTSVSSPEFVGALVLFEQKFGRFHRQGNVNYFLYAAGALQSLFGGPKAPSSLQFYHRDIPGFDGIYNGDEPGKNYSYIYGNGSPDVRKLFGLTQYAPAGLPQTPSNP
jgi:subtilase family serine protease